MMQHEFENLIGREISSNEYEKVEKVYMHIADLTKQKIADLYKHDDMFVTATLYGHVLIDNGLDANFKSRIEKLECNVQDCEIQNAELIAENETLQNKIDELQTQLHQYKVLFSDIEQNMTVSLYGALLGITR